MSPLGHGVVVPVFTFDSGTRNSTEPEVRGGLCVVRFLKHFEHYFISIRWYFPRTKDVVHDAQESCHNIVRREMQQFSH